MGRTVHGVIKPPPGTKEGLTPTTSHRHRRWRCENLSLSSYLGYAENAPAPKPSSQTSVVIKAKKEPNPQPQPLVNRPQPINLKVQDQSVFTEDGSWVFLPLGSVNPLVISPGNKQAREIKLFPEGNTLGFRSFRKGYFWDVRKQDSPSDPTQSRTCLFRLSPSAVPSVWENVAQIDTESGIPNYLVPLDRDGWFLAVGPYFGFISDGHASPVALFCLKEGQLLFQELVDLPYNGKANIGELIQETRTPLKGANPNDPEPKPWILKRCQISPSSLRPNLWTPALLPDHLVLGATQAGVLWFFSLKNGQCLRSVDLGGVDPKDLDQLRYLDHFLLAAEPNDTNQLVVVTRDPDVLTFAKNLTPPLGATDEVNRQAKERYAEVTAEMTSLQWWSIDPETGKKERLQRPEEFPEHTFFNQQTQLRFLVGPDGHIHANTSGPWSRTLEQMALAKPPAAPEAPAAKVESKP